VGVGILKDDLDIAPQPAHLSTLLGVHIHAIKGELAGGRFFQPHQQPTKA
jgi:hypothetical protein